MSAFTPGPWFVRDIASASIYVGPSGGGPSVAIAPTRVNVPAGETMANARLIAAAPGLLQELQNIVDADWTKWHPETRTAQEFVSWAKSRARAAIAKATGEQP